MQTLAGLPLFITILAIALGTVLTRSLPFIMFPQGKDTPAFVKKLQSLLPSAVIGLLVVYCLRGVSISSASHGIPELAASVVIVVLHLWRKNALSSIAGGTLSYMLLVQYVFS